MNFCANVVQLSIVTTVSLGASAHGATPTKPALLVPTRPIMRAPLGISCT
jgi:hypothetical protein